MRGVRREAAWVLKAEGERSGEGPGLDEGQCRVYDEVDEEEGVVVGLTRKLREQTAVWMAWK